MEIVVRATIIFVFLLILTRGLKRRTLADMAPFEMILLVVVGDIVQQGVTQEDFSLTGAVLAAATFGFWVTVLSYASWRWAPVGRAIDGVPLVIVQDGRDRKCTRLTPVTNAQLVCRLLLDTTNEP